MTIIEKKSERKKKAIIKLVESGEYSIAYALILAEELNDTGKLLDADYEELAEYLEKLLEEEKETETVVIEADKINLNGNVDFEESAVEETNEESEE